MGVFDPSFVVSISLKLYPSIRDNTLFSGANNVAYYADV